VQQSSLVAMFIEYVPIVSARTVHIQEEQKDVRRDAMFDELACHGKGEDIFAADGFRYKVRAKKYSAVVAQPHSAWKFIAFTWYISAWTSSLDRALLRYWAIEDKTSSGDIPRSSKLWRHLIPCRRSPRSQYRMNRPQSTRSIAQQASSMSDYIKVSQVL